MEVVFRAGNFSDFFRSGGGNHRLGYFLDKTFLCHNAAFSQYVMNLFLEFVMQNENPWLSLN
jgi:hypothetical protein